MVDSRTSIQQSRLHQAPTEDSPVDKTGHDRCECTEHPTSVQPRLEARLTRPAPQEGAPGSETSGAPVATALARGGVVRTCAPMAACIGRVAAGERTPAGELRTTLRTAWPAGRSVRMPCAELRMLPTGAAALPGSILVDAERAARAAAISAVRALAGRGFSAQLPRPTGEACRRCLPRDADRDEEDLRGSLYGDLLCGCPG